MAQIYFAGEHYCSLDNKNRISIPSNIRRLIAPDAENTLIFAPGFEDVNLYAYPQNEWNRLTDKFKKMKAFDKTVRDFIRLFVGRAFPSTMDAQGRIMLPERILKIAGIGNEILVLGSISRLEMWNPKTYQEYMGDMRLSDLAKQLNISDMLLDED